MNAPNTITKKEIKQQLKGYKVSIRKHMIIYNAVTLFVSDAATGAAICGDFNVYPVGLYEAHRAALDYIASLKGSLLDTGQKIV